MRNPYRVTVNGKSTRFPKPWGAERYFERRVDESTAPVRLERWRPTKREWDALRERAG